MIVSAIAGAVGFLVSVGADVPSMAEIRALRTPAPTRIYHKTGQGLELAAEMVDVRRVPVSLDQVSEHFVEALIAVEDENFYHHHGVDYRSVARASVQNLVHLTRGKRLVGASTLTQQLARRLSLQDQDRTLKRKLTEIITARRIDQAFDKEHILELYMNTVYFGRGAWGIERAARLYFGISAKELSIPQAAFLAGLPKAPDAYSKTENRDRALARKDYVLDRMAATGSFNILKAALLKRQKLILQENHRDAPIKIPRDYFTDQVQRELKWYFGDQGAATLGLQVTSTMDPVMQTIAERVLAEQLVKLERRQGIRKGLSGALVALDPATGHILALVGGRDYQKSQFNRAAQALRQPGSAIKPFLYVAAFDKGYQAHNVIYDTPTYLPASPYGAEEPWFPKNANLKFNGPVTIEQALTWSRNMPAIRLGMDIGIEQLIDYANVFGLGYDWPKAASLSLGAGEVRLIDLAAAYGMLANGGKPLVATTIQNAQNAKKTHILDVANWYCKGCLLLTPLEKRRQYLNRTDRPTPQRESIGLVTRLLEGVVTQGTGRRAKQGLNFAFAGKTGTTNDSHDAWFVGYTPKLVVAVFVGYDTPASMGSNATGGRLAAPIFNAFIKQMLDGEIERFDQGMRVTASNLNLRSSASTAGHILAVMPRGAPVENLGCSEGWCQVRYEDTVGFAAESYVSSAMDLTGPSPASVPAVGDTALQWGTVGSGAKPKGYIVGEEAAVFHTGSAYTNAQILPPQTPLLVFACDAQWCLAATDRNSGYIKIDAIAEVLQEGAGDVLGALAHRFENVQRYQVKKQATALYSVPDRGSSVLTAIPANAYVWVTARIGDWCHVTRNDPKGYVFNGYAVCAQLTRARESREAQELSFENLSATLDPSIITLGQDNSNGQRWQVRRRTSLRSAPQSDSALLMTIPRKTIIWVNNCSAGWCRIAYQGQIGFTRQTDIKKINIRAIAPY